MHLSPVTPSFLSCPSPGPFLFPLLPLPWSLPLSSPAPPLSLPLPSPAPPLSLPLSSPAPPLVPSSSPSCPSPGPPSSPSCPSPGPPSSLSCPSPVPSSSISCPPLVPPLPSPAPPLVPPLPSPAPPLVPSSSLSCPSPGPPSSLSCPSPGPPSSLSCPSPGPFLFPLLPLPCPFLFPLLPLRPLFADFAGDFVNSFRNSLPLVSFLPPDQLRNALDTLIENFDGNIMITGQSYNISAFLQNVTDRLLTLATQRLDSGDTTRQMCVANFIRQRINQTAVDLVGRGLAQIRRGVTSAVRILTFLRNFNLTLGNFQPLQRCRDRLVQLSFCSRCTGRIPPLCSNTCGALIRACYSPFVDGLRGEFDNLWDVTRQVVHATNTTLMQIFSEENPIIMLDLTTVRPVLSSLEHMKFAVGLLSQGGGGAKQNRESLGGGGGGGIE